MSSPILTTLNFPAATLFRVSDFLHFLHSQGSSSCPPQDVGPSSRTLGALSPVSPPPCQPSRASPGGACCGSRSLWQRCPLLPVTYWSLASSCESQRPRLPAAVASGPPVPGMHPGGDAPQWRLCYKSCHWQPVCSPRSAARLPFAPRPAVVPVGVVRALLLPVHAWAALYVQLVVVTVACEARRGCFRAVETLPWKLHRSIRPDTSSLSGRCL